jgi:23S rRNA (adenine2503-C2)-methyltransferase
MIGRGKLHAGIVYENYMRRAALPQQHPAFKNCPQLLEDILNRTEWPDLCISKQQVEGSTSKFLLKTHDQLEVESVLIPMQAGGTLCISSQVGCRMGCSFCETGRMGLLRNLSSAEIVGQVFAARHLLKFSFRNIVFMGMGEPFDNYNEVMQAAVILMDPKRFGYGKKHLTISTSGCIEGILRIAQAGHDTPNLAVSINAPTDDIRNRLMPVHRKQNLQELYEAMQFYGQQTGRQILAAYVLT